MVFIIPCIGSGPSCMEFWGGERRGRCSASWKIPLGGGLKIFLDFIHFTIQRFLRNFGQPRIFPSKGLFSGTKRHVWIIGSGCTNADPSWILAQQGHKAWTNPLKFRENARLTGRVVRKIRYGVTSRSVLAYHEGKNPLVKCRKNRLFPLLRENITIGYGDDEIWKNPIREDFLFNGIAFFSHLNSTGKKITGIQFFKG